MPKTRRFLGPLAVIACAAALAPSAPAAPESPKPLIPVDLTDAREQPVAEARADSAKNETVAIGLRVTVPNKDRARKKLSLQIGQLKSAGGAVIDPAKNVIAYQVIDLPAETNRAAYVRHTGLTTAQARQPAALVPLVQEKGGRVQLAQVRDAGKLTAPGDKDAGIPEPVTVWLDLHIPAEVPAGEYAAAVQLTEKGLLGESVLGSLPVKVVVDDFVLADDRHLLMVSPVAWETLYKHWPKEFEAITPRLLNRDEPRHAGAIRVLDQIAQVAQRNRVQIVFSRLQPTVKWPAGAPPQVDWSDFDTVLGPWMTGEGFADKVAYGYWPLPKVDALDRYERPARVEYWQAAATHFDQHDWLFDSSVMLDRPTTGTDDRQRREVTAEAAAIVRGHTRVRVTAPVPEATLDVSEKPADGRIDLANAARVIAWGPGLVYAPPTRPWPAGIDEPGRFLSVNMHAPTPYVGVGESQRDVRQWAWLSFLQGAGMVLWNEALPKADKPDAPQGPAEQVWIYPGRWFGVSGPVESVQLKWARRAAQDYEYLWLARQRGEVVSPDIVASLLSKPVEVAPGATADPVYSLVSGTVDPTAWDEARRIVSRAIALAPAGQKVDQRRAEELRLEAVRWTTQQGRPTVLVRDVKWSPSAEGGWADVKIGLDVYSPTTDPAEQNSMEWAGVPNGWVVKPRPVAVPTLEPNHVRRVDMDGRFDLDQSGLATAAEGRVDFVSGYTGGKTGARFVLPVAVSDRHEGAIHLDGDLADWNELDALQNGPMVRMLTQPDLRTEKLLRASTPTSVYSGWGEDAFYVAFKVAGVAGDLKAGRNFVEYQQRRAWGEDLVEVVIQGLYDAGKTGPALHLVCKPNGQWIERKAVGETEWSPAGGAAAVLYAGRVEADVWRGELSLPWKLIDDVKFGHPRFLRFNFVQHKAATGESASWAGPVDYGRDESMAGVIVLRDKGK